jgi:predicted regulator of Ras-like GTPase activity (Roadblock/LC7/MglB family)
MKDMILFPEDIERLNTVLAPLVTKAKLLLAVLINRDGRVLTHQGNLAQVDIISLAALVAGNTASTLAIANLVGEAEFEAMYHQGKDKNIYIDSLDENTFLSVVFDDQTNIDRVKVFIRQFERQLKEAVLLVYAKDEDQIDLDLDMGNNSFQHIPQEDGQPQSRQPSYPPQQQSSYPQQSQYFQPQPAPPAMPPAGQYIQNKRKQHPPST